MENAGSLQNPLPIADGAAFDAIANFLLMGWDAYPSPEDAAAGLLKRLAHEGYHVAKFRGDSHG